MAAETRSQIRTQLRAEIAQTDANNSDFSDSDLNDIIDRAITHVAAQGLGNRRFDNIAAVLNQADYDISSTSLTYDTVKIRNAYFGDVNTPGDVRNLIIITEEKLKSVRQGWLDATTTSQGRPLYLIMKDKKTITINPRPDSNNVTNRNIIISRDYFPTALSSDSSYPDLQPGYHDLLMLYCCFLCYSGKLLNSDKAAFKLKQFEELLKLIKPTIDKEADEAMALGFVMDEGLDDNTYMPIIPY